jgi:tetratricopeptide (TPR) repeat protein
MFDWELNKLTANLGHLVSGNAFFSASRNEDVAEIFAGHGELADSHVKSVVLQIEVNTQLQHTTAVPIAHLSEMPLENEVLFSLSSVFKVLNVCEESERNRWRVHLQTTDEGRELIDEYKHISLMDDECPTSEIVFGRLLMNMGQCAQAVKYFTSVTNRLDSTHQHEVVLRAAIICGQSECLYHMGRYEEARQCSEQGLASLDNLGMSSTSILYLRCRYHLANALLLTKKVQQARKILEETLHQQRCRLHENHVHIADTLKAVGLMIGIESGYDKSLNVREEALRIYEKILPENHPKRINALVSLAGSYEATGEFQVALDYLYRALRMQERYLPDEHSSRAVTLRSLAVVHEALDERDIAFDYYIRAYSIWMLLYPEGHRYTVFCLNKIGGNYRARKQFSEALQCQIQALEMHTKLSKNDTSQPYGALGRTYLEMGDNVKAIETLHLACDYSKAKTNDLSNKYLNGTESLLATAYSHHGEYHKAQEIFERVYSLQKNAHPEGNPDIGFTLHHMASNLVRMSEYKRAMQCYRESLDMLRNYFSESHCEVVLVREKMATVQILIRKIQQD